MSKNKDLQTLKTNDNVRIRFEGNWNRKGRIIKKLKELRSYLLQTVERKYLRCRYFYQSIQWIHSTRFVAPHPPWLKISVCPTIYT